VSRTADLKLIYLGIFEIKYWHESQYLFLFTLQPGQDSTTALFSANTYLKEKNNILDICSNFINSFVIVSVCIQFITEPFSIYTKYFDVKGLK